MTNSQTTPEPGQIWQEVDLRFERFLRVIAIENSGAHIETVYRTYANDGVWHTTGRKGAAKLSRFNGKRGGYRYVEG